MWAHIRSKRYQAHGPDQTYSFLLAGVRASFPISLSLLIWQAGMSSLSVVLGSRAGNPAYGFCAVQWRASTNLTLRIWRLLSVTPLRASASEYSGYQWWLLGSPGLFRASWCSLKDKAERCSESAKLVSASHPSSSSQADFLLLFKNPPFNICLPHFCIFTFAQPQSI